MNVKISLIVCYLVLEAVNAASVYDQSQTGNLNVQIDLKDLQIIALTKSAKEEYVDYDYAYDYSEMTIKPQNGITQKPLNVSTTSNSTTADISKDNTTIATMVYAETTTIESIKNSTAKPLEAETATENHTTVKSTTTAKSVNYKYIKQTTKKSETTVTLAPPPANSTNCNRGFVLCDSQQQNKPLSILELLSQRFKRREHRKKSDKE